MTSTSAVAVRLELFTPDGQATSYVGNLSLHPNAHVCSFLDQIQGFGSLPQNFEGVLRISTSAAEGISVTAVKVRYNERREFLISTVEPVREGTPSNEQLFFPHIVQAGGYTMSFPLFDAGAEAFSGTLEFFGQVRQPLPLEMAP